MSLINMIHNMIYHSKPSVVAKFHSQFSLTNNCVSLAIESSLFGFVLFVLLV